MEQEMKVTQSILKCIKDSTSFLSFFIIVYESCTAKRNHATFTVKTPFFLTSRGHTLEHDVIAHLVGPQLEPDLLPAVVEDLGLLGGD